MKILKKRILAYTLALAVLLSSLVFGVSAVEPETPTEEVPFWEGETATGFVNPDAAGTEADPYIIETAEQLRYFVENYSTQTASSGKFFKLTKDIYLNDVVDGTSVVDLYGKRNWLEGVAASSKANSFSGTFDGDGHTVYGLYVNGAGGLFPAINSYTTIKNLNIENAFVHGGEGNSGALAGTAYYTTWQNAANISNCSVTNATIGQAEDVKYGGGFIGYIYSTTMNFTNCYATGLNMSVATWVANNTPGAIVGAGESGGTLRMTNCYTTDYFVTSGGFARTNYAYTNVYTTAALPGNNNDTGVTLLEDAQMKGDAAKDHMTGFDFKYTWKTVTNGYPVFSGIKFWDGTTDTSFLEKNAGTADDPYIIETAAQLRGMVDQIVAYENIKSLENPITVKRPHYKIVNDIYLNPVTEEDMAAARASAVDGVNDGVAAWDTKGFKKWRGDWSQSSGFYGEVDGGGHTVYGVYSNTTYAGLINDTVGNTVIKNLHVKDSYFYGKVVGGITAQPYGANSTLTIIGCSVDNTAIEGSIKDSSSTGSVRVGGIVGGADTTVKKIAVSYCSVTNMTFETYNTTYPGIESAFIGYVGTSGSHNVSNCYSDNTVHPVCNVTDTQANFNTIASRVAYKNVYTTYPETFAEAGVATVADMKGEAAKTNMLGFNFDNAWETVNGGYPVLRDNAQLVWGGGYDLGFKGQGTAESPYLVETPEQLAYIVSVKGVAYQKYYFKVVNDINIHDTTKADWKNNAFNWVWADVRFQGTVDGDGHTIDGLYFSGSQKRFGLFSYVGDTLIKNLKFSNAYIYDTFPTTSSNDDDQGMGILCAQASAKADFDKIYIDETCYLEAPYIKGVAGIVGRSNQNINITNSAVLGTIKGESHVGSFYGTHWGGTQTVNNSFSDSNAPIMPSRALATSANNYATVVNETNESGAVTLVTTDQMKGENAKTYMSGLDFLSVWKVTKDGYPVYLADDEKLAPWGGAPADTSVISYAGGEGTKESPYKIENGDQLYKMVAENSAVAVGAFEEAQPYFEIVADINLGNKQWYVQSKTTDNLISTNYTAGFNGIVYGNGHKIYGLKVSGTTSSAIGLIPVVTQGAEIHDLHLVNGNLTQTAWNGRAVGAFVGIAVGAAESKPVVIDGCSVKGFNIQSENGSAAFVAYSYSQSVKIKDCFVADSSITQTGTDAASNSSAFIAAMRGSDFGNSIVIESSYYLADVSPSLISIEGDFSEIVTFNSVYTNNTNYDGSVTGVTLLNDEQMKGDAAKKNMFGIDFYGTWETVENAYPVHRALDDRMEAWDGTKAATFAGGDGTAGNPYQIANGAQLYKMVAEFSGSDVLTAPTTQTYFRITADINLGGKKWYTNTLWKDDLTSANYTKGFNGVVYGEGHTIYGLTVNGTSAYSNVGLIPIAAQGAEIHDLHLAGGYLKQTAWNGRAVGALIGMAVGVAGSEPIVIEGCSVKDFDIQSENGSAAFVAYSYSQSINIKDSFVVNTTMTQTGTDANSNSAAFIAVMRGSAEYNSVVIENSYYCGDGSLQFIELEDQFGEITTFKNVYTTSAAYDGSIAGLTKLSDAEMKGKLAGFNYNQVWQLVDGGYSVQLPYEVKSNLWNGAEALVYAGGAGTEADPYLISKPNQLYKLANATREETLGRFYKLTNDITVSRVYDGWTNDNIYTWAVGKAYLDGFTYASSFAGTLDGAGYTVSGIYYNNEITDNGDYAFGMIPFATSKAIIKNITVSDVVASVSGNGAAVGAVVGAVHVTPEDAEDAFNYVKFVGVNVENASINAAYSGDIVGRATNGVRFEICNAGNIIGQYNDNVVMNGCNEGLSVGSEDVLVYTPATINATALYEIRSKLMGFSQKYIADINNEGEFNIADLVRARRLMDAEAPEDTNEYKLVWSQEFNNNTLDESVWAKNTTMGRKSNLVYADNATVSGNKLNLACKDTGEVDENGNKIYSVSHGLSTVDTMSFKYGRLEMRAKIPFGAGAFPSLWLTSRNAIGNGVSPYGYDTEIDIFEVFGKSTSQDRMVTCMHKWYVDENGNRIKDADGNSIECSNGTGKLSGNGSKIEEVDRSHQVTEAGKTAWHTIVFEWTEDTMTFTVDGESFDIKLSQLGDFDLTGYDTDSAGLYNQFMYLRLNNHMHTVGGTSYIYGGGEGDIDPSKLTYEIDYIRLYQNDSGEINLK